MDILLVGISRNQVFEQKNLGLQIGTIFFWNELISFDSLIGISKINNLRIQDIYLFPIEDENYTDYGYESEETLTTYQLNLYHEKETLIQPYLRRLLIGLGGMGKSVQL